MRLPLLNYRNKLALFRVCGTAHDPCSPYLKMPIRITWSGRNHNHAPTLSRLVSLTKPPKLKLIEMRQVRLRAGSVIFSEGEESDAAYRIISGKVQISLDTKSGPLVLSKLRAGEFFGEMGMVENLPRSASARTSDETVLEVITPENFFDYIGSDQDMLSGYFHSVFERFRVSRLKLRMLLGNETSTGYIGRNDRTLEDGFFGSSSDKNEVDQEKPTLQLTFQPPEGDPVQEIIGKFPFRIGRSYGYNDISIQDKEPYEVSRNHCCIEEHSGHFFVRDLGSKLGTVVNGRRIGKNQLGTSEELTRGENIIILGRDASAYRLRLTAF